MTAEAGWVQAWLVISLLWWEGRRSPQLRAVGCSAASTAGPGPGSEESAPGHELGRTVISWPCGNIVACDGCLLIDIAAYSFYWHLKDRVPWMCSTTTTYFLFQDILQMSRSRWNQIRADKLMGCSCNVTYVTASNGINCSYQRWSASALRFNVSLFHQGKVVVPKLIEVLSALQNSFEYLALVYLYF